MVSRLYTHYVYTVKVFDLVPEVEMQYVCGILHGQLSCFVHLTVYRIAYIFCVVVFVFSAIITIIVAVMIAIPLIFAHKLLQVILIDLYYGHLHRRHVHYIQRHISAARSR